MTEASFAMIGQRGWGLVDRYIPQIKTQPQHLIQYLKKLFF
jgi:hypothetical protein